MHQRHFALLSTESIGTLKKAAEACQPLMEMHLEDMDLSR
jgi:hypothetical protein